MRTFSWVGGDLIVRIGVGFVVVALTVGGSIGGSVGAALAQTNYPPPPDYYPPPRGYYPPPPGYYPPPPAAYGPPPGPGYAQLAPGCYWAQRRVWVEGVGYRMRTVQACQ